MTDEFGIARGSHHGCLIFNIQHDEALIRFLMVAAQVLNQSGPVSEIHWRFDLGVPKSDKFVHPAQTEDIIGWGTASRVLTQSSSIIDLPPWRYGVRLAHRVI